MTQESKALQTPSKKEIANVELAQDRPVFTPATDIYEKDDAILVLCDMPGVDEKHVDVTLEDGVLTITGEQDAGTPEGYNLIHEGYRTGIFRRSFTVTADVDASKIDAKLSKGVLKLVLPKAEAARPRKITVVSGD